MSESTKKSSKTTKDEPMEPVMMMPTYFGGCGPARFSQRKNPTDAKLYDYRGARTNLRNPNGFPDSVAHLMMYALGSGLVALHSAYQECGIWSSLVLTILLSALTTYCVCTLVWSAQKLYGRVQTPQLTYPEVVEVAVLLSPWPMLRQRSRYFRYAVEGTLILHLYGSCCVLMIMIARNLKELVEGTDTISDDGDPPLTVYILSLMVPCTAVCMVTNLKNLAPFALVAISYAVAIIIMLIWYGFKKTTINPLDKPGYKGVMGIFEFIGVFTFIVETASIALPIENNMDKPQKFHFVEVASMSIVAVMMMTVGFFGYCLYGELSVAPITVHFPFTPFAIQIKVMLCLVLYVIYAINFYLAFDIEWIYIKTHHLTANYWFWERVYRGIHVIIVALIAFALPNVTRLMGIIGSFCSAPVVFIWPSFVEILVEWDYPGLGRYKWRLMKFISLTILSQIIFIAGTFYNVVGYIDEMRNPLREFKDSNISK